jgi:hypothetical protein
MTVVIGLSAVVIAIQEGEAAVLTVRPEAARGGEQGAVGLPFGPFDPQGARTFELQLRAFVTQQTGFEIGYVEQLYTFGDKGRDAPVADVGAGAARVISVGYLALAPQAPDSPPEGAAWAAWPLIFPWEDWRGGRPTLIDDVIAPALEAWSRETGEAESQTRRARARLLFAQNDAPWNEERVLERYELLYEAGLVEEAARDRALTPPAGLAHLGLPMISDHRRILATGLARLRGKIKYRPVIFELMPPRFTLLQLQRTVEAISGVRLHKQNFRRVVERTGLVEGLGVMETRSGGRPAELFRFRRERLSALPVSGLSLPLARE